MTCACCGLAFGVQGRGRYQCLGQKVAYSPDGKTSTCHGAFSAKEVDNAVWQAVASMIKNPDVLLAGLEQRQAEKEAELQPNRDYLSRMRGQLDKVNNTLDIVRERYLDFVEPDEKVWLDEQRQNLNTQRSTLQAKIADLEGRLALAQIGDIPPEEIRLVCYRIQDGINAFTFERKRLLIELLDVRVLAHRGPAVKRTKKPHGSGTLTISGYIPVPEIEIVTEESTGTFALPVS